MLPSAAAAPAFLPATEIDLARRPVVSFPPHTCEPPQARRMAAAHQNAARTRSCTLSYASPDVLIGGKWAVDLTTSAQHPVPAPETPTTSEASSAAFYEQPPHLPLDASPQLKRRSRHRPRLRARRFGACHNRHHIRSHLLGALDRAAQHLAAPSTPGNLTKRPGQVVVRDSPQLGAAGLEHVASRFRSMLPTKVF